MGAWELFMIGLGWLLWNNNERERHAEIQYIQQQRLENPLTPPPPRPVPPAAA